MNGWICLMERLARFGVKAALLQNDMERFGVTILRHLKPFGLDVQVWPVEKLRFFLLTKFTITGTTA